MRADGLNELLTVDDLAAVLKLSPSWVYEHTRTRRRAARLPYIKIGKYRFDPPSRTRVPRQTVAIDRQPDPLECRPS
jgi:helix-turn-helix protein